MPCICNSPVRPDFKDSYNDLLDKPTINGTIIDGNVETDNLGIKYPNLTDKPTINGVMLDGNLTTADLGIEIETEGILKYKVRNEQIVCNVPYADGVDTGFYFTLDLEFLNKYTTGEKLQDDTLYIIPYSSSTPILISMQNYSPNWTFTNIQGITQRISASRIAATGPLYILGGKCYFGSNPEEMVSQPEETINEQ